MKYRVGATGEYRNSVAGMIIGNLLSRKTNSSDAVVDEDDEEIMDEDIAKEFDSED